MIYQMPSARNRQIEFETERQIEFETELKSSSKRNAQSSSNRTSVETPLLLEFSIFAAAAAGRPGRGPRRSRPPPRPVAAAAKIENSRRVGRLDRRPFRTQLGLRFELDLTFRFEFDLTFRFELDSTSWVGRGERVH